MALLIERPSSCCRSGPRRSPEAVLVERSSYFCTTLLNPFECLFCSLSLGHFQHLELNKRTLNPESDFVLGRDGLLFVQLQLVPVLRFAMREACIAFQTEARGALDIFGAVVCVMQTGSIFRATSPRGCELSCNDYNVMQCHALNMSFLQQCMTAFN